MPNEMQALASGAVPAPANGQPIDVGAIEAETLAGSVESPVDPVLDDDAAIEAAAAAGEITKKEAQVLKKKLKIKVDGVESEEDIDFNDEETLRKHLQKSKAFDKRMQEYSGYKNQMDQILEMLDKDPEGLLEKLGKNVDELAEKRLTKRVEELKKSPEQVANEKMQKELEDLRAAAKKAQEANEMAELEKLKNQHALEIERDIKEALDSTDTILPKRNKAILSRIGQGLNLAMKNGYPQATAKDIIPFIQQQYLAELAEVFTDMPEDKLEAIIGKPVLEKWRKSLISKSKAAIAVPVKAKIEDVGVKKSTVAEDSKTAAEKQKEFKNFFRMNT